MFNIPSGIPTDQAAVLQRYRDHNTEEDFVVTAREYNALRRLGRDVYEIESDSALLKKGIMGYRIWMDDGVPRRATVRIPVPAPSGTNQDLNLDHWPPNLHELADAFAAVERATERVVGIKLAVGDDALWGDQTREYGTAMVGTNGKSCIWGSVLTFFEGGPVQQMVVRGESGTTATLRGPAAGPPTGPIHVTRIPPPYVPTESDLAVAQRYDESFAEEDLIFTAKEFAILSKLRRDALEFESSIEAFKQGRLGAKTWRDSNGEFHRVPVHVRRST